MKVEDRRQYTEHSMSEAASYFIFCLLCAVFLFTTHHSYTIPCGFLRKRAADNGGC